MVGQAVVALVLLLLLLLLLLRPTGLDGVGIYPSAPPVAGESTGVTHVPRVGGGVGSVRMGAHGVAATAAVERLMPGWCTRAACQQ